MRWFYKNVTDPMIRVDNKRQIQGHGHEQSKGSLVIYLVVALLLLTIFQCSNAYMFHSVYTEVRFETWEIVGVSLMIAVLSLAFWMSKWANWKSECLLLGFWFICFWFQFFGSKQSNGFCALLDCILPRFAYYYSFSWTPVCLVQAGSSQLEEYQLSMNLSFLLFHAPFIFATAKALIKKPRAVAPVACVLFDFLLFLCCGETATIGSIILMVGTLLAVVGILHQRKMVYPAICPAQYASGVIVIGCFLSSYFLAGIWTQGYLEKYILPAQDYVYASSWEDVVRDIRHFFEEKGSGSVVSGGGVAHGNLQNTGNLILGDAVDMQVMASRPILGNYYLKGYVGEVYDGKRWSKSNDDLPAQLRSSLSMWQQCPEYRILSVLEQKNNGNVVGRCTQISVQTKPHMKENFYPYASDYEIREGSSGQMEGKDYFQTYYMDPEQLIREYGYYQRDVQVTSWGPTLFSEEDELERIYREYVYAHYLDVPNSVVKLRTELQRLQGDRKLYCDQAVELVKEYLAEQAIYSLNPGAIPADSDFADTFLYEKKCGFCMHFATAGTLMFRLLGIPARYVEGYLVPKQEYAYTWTEVTADLAHAWTEIYLDGYGWVPVEVTPTYNSLQSGEHPTESVTQSTSEPPEETTTEEAEATTLSSSEETTKSEEITEPEVSEKTTNAPTKRPTKPDVPVGATSDKEQSTTDNTDEDDPAIATGSMDNEGKDDSFLDASEEADGIPAVFRMFKTGLWYLLLLMMPVVLLSGVVLFRYHYIRKKRNKEMKVSNRKRAVVRIYHEMVRLCRKDGFDFSYESSAFDVFEKYAAFADLQSVAKLMNDLQMALFSDEEISEEQYRTVYRGYRVLCKEVLHRGTAWKRLRLRWMDCY